MCCVIVCVVTYVSGVQSLDSGGRRGRGLGFGGRVGAAERGAAGRPPLAEPEGETRRF